MAGHNTIIVILNSQSAQYFIKFTEVEKKEDLHEVIIKLHTASTHEVTVASIVVCAASVGRLEAAAVAILLPPVRFSELTRMTDLVKAQ
jgi:Ni,Fe-hydrogenase maturation factor